MLHAIDHAEVHRNRRDIGNIAMTDALKVAVVDAGALDPMVAALQAGSSEKICYQAARGLFTLSATDSSRWRLPAPEPSLLCCAAG